MAIFLADTPSEERPRMPLGGPFSPSGGGLEGPIGRLGRPEAPDPPSPAGRFRSRRPSFPRREARRKPPRKTPLLASKQRLSALRQNRPKRPGNPARALEKGRQKFGGPQKGASRQTFFADCSTVFHTDFPSKGGQERPMDGRKRKGRPSSRRPFSFASLPPRCFAAMPLAAALKRRGRYGIIPPCEKSFSPCCRLRCSQVACRQLRRPRTAGR